MKSPAIQGEVFIQDQPDQSVSLVIAPRIGEPAGIRLTYQEAAVLANSLWHLSNRLRKEAIALRRATRKVGGL